MQYSRIFRDYYRTNRDEYILTCTCGYATKIKKQFYKLPDICPNCNSYISLIEDKFIHNNRSNKKHTFINFEIIDMKNKSFHIKKTNVKTDLVENKETNMYEIKIKEQEYFETFFDCEKPNEMIILRNGVKISVKEHNIEKSLSNIDINNKIFDNTIFKDYFNIIGKNNVFSKIVKDLKDYPQYEIFYNTYGTLNGIKNLNKKFLKKGRNPSDILGLPNSVWKTIYNLNKNDSYCGYIYNQFSDIISFALKYKNKPDIIINVIENCYKIDINQFSNFVELFESNYNCNRLVEYLTEDIYIYQGISNCKEGFQLLYDYVHMCKLMDIEFEKYPKSLKLRHDLASKNLNIMVSDKEAKEMELVLKDTSYKNLSYKGIKYSVLLPKNANDIINEGKQLSHCGGSYVDLVKNKKTMMLFMRNNENLEKSLITLEVRNNTLRQYAGFGDRYPNEEEMEFIYEYCKVKKLDINDKHAMYYRD